MPLLLRKSHNVTTLLYHLVFPVKYRRFIFTNEFIENELIDECYKIQESYDIRFESIGVDGDHLHYVVQGEPTRCVTDIVRIIKSFTGKRVKRTCAKEIYGKLRGGKIRSSGYFANTVGASAGFETISNYVLNQGYASKGYKVKTVGNEEVKQLSLFG